jgi:hypothetical protein
MNSMEAPYKFHTEVKRRKKKENRRKRRRKKKLSPPPRIGSWIRHCGVVYKLVNNLAGRDPIYKKHNSILSKLISSRLFTIYTSTFTCLTQSRHGGQERTGRQSARQG